MADRDAGEGTVFSFYEMQKMECQGARERYPFQRYLPVCRFIDVNHQPEMSCLVVAGPHLMSKPGSPSWSTAAGRGKSPLAQSIHNAIPPAPRALS